MVKLPWVSRAAHEREVHLLKFALQNVRDLHASALELYLKQLTATRGAQKGLRRLRDEIKALRAYCAFNHVDKDQK